MVNAAGTVIPKVWTPTDGATYNGAELVILGTGIDVVGFAPQYIGQRVVFLCTDSTADATVTCLAGVTAVTATGTSTTILTFDTTGDVVEFIAVSMTRWVMLASVTVTLG
jgi:energy-converting hydrogenase Eha subunit E